MTLTSVSQHSLLHLARPAAGWSAQPLETLTLTGTPGATVVVRDGAGQVYAQTDAAPEITFTVGGHLGTHTVEALAADGAVLDRLTFTVDAQTTIADDGGRFAEIFAMLNKTMRCYNPAGIESRTYNGKQYQFYVPWILDHAHTAKGMMYVSDKTAGMADLFGDAQKENGMVWSFIFPAGDASSAYYLSAYGPYGYAKVEGGALFGRQPVENHNEYNYLDTLYLAWKANGDDAWMISRLENAKKALDYSVTDRARWSERFSLLKRGYTIDSWDFQVHDEYTVEFPLATAQNIDPDRTKFGVFHGDNHGYALACAELAEMLEVAGQTDEAATYRERGLQIMERLNTIAWNGRFFTHHVEEDPTVKRNLGVDESTQIAMSNCYALNRGISHEQSVAILETYRDLQANAPAGSPGEWYAIYPPFGRGFGADNDRWQYMNAGVHGHAAGELARGAFEHGYERYGVDILLRINELAKKTNGRVAFAYTGGIDPAPAPQVFTPVDLSAVANMDFRTDGAPGVPGWMGGDKDNDLVNLPTGAQTFADVPYCIADPAANGRRGAVAVSTRTGFASQVEIPLNALAGALYLAHTVGNTGPSGTAVAVTFRYDDGAEASSYLMNGKHISGWWFPNLQGKDAGVAWGGPNGRCTYVGLGWAAIANPHPEKTIASITLTATLDGAIYALAGLTLADRMPYHQPGLLSTGGPDNWSGGTCMAALINGLVGVIDTDRALQQVRLSPRWVAAEVASTDVIVRYPASQGYLAYQYRHDAVAHRLTATVTGNASHTALRLLLPEGATEATSITVDGQPVPCTTEQIENSRYAVLTITPQIPVVVAVTYR